MENYLTFKSEGIHSQATTCVNLKVIVLNETSQSQKLSYFVIPHMCII